MQRLGTLVSVPCEMMMLTDHLRTVSCSLDTGRLDKETYELFDRVEKHYGIRIEYTFPDAHETMELVRAKGMFSFYQDGHQECCRVRKVCIHPPTFTLLHPEASGI